MNLTPREQDLFRGRASRLFEEALGEFVRSEDPVEFARRMRAIEQIATSLSSRAALRIYSRRVSR